MIEMLGVLAIIGVLSVGGIAGYSKAMMKYRVNKTADQIATIAANVRTLFASQKQYKGLSENHWGWYPDWNLVKKAHLIPDEMYTGSNASDVENAFGGLLFMSASGKNSDSDDKAFTIGIQGVPEEACMELATMDWGSGSSSGLIAVGKWVSGQYVNCKGQDDSAAKACPNGEKVSVPMPVSIAAKMCGSDTNNNVIMWKFY